MTRLTRALARLAGLVPELEVTGSGQDRVRPGAGRSGLPLHERSLVVRSDVRAVVRDLTGVLGRWGAYAWSIDPAHATDAVPDWCMAAPGSADRLAAQVAYLRRSISRIRSCQRAGDLLAEVTAVTARVGRTVDIPAQSSRFEVGPCPEWTGDGGVITACSGTVHAVIGVGDPGTRPSRMTCDACGRRWGTAEWYRTGRRILARRSEIARAQRRNPG